MKSRIGFLAGIVASFLAAAGLLAACAPQPDRRNIDLKDRLSEQELRSSAPRADPEVLMFGFDRRLNPQEDARQYIPFLDYLNKATGYRFELRFVSGKGDIADDLGTGKVQFAAIGAGTFLRARERYGAIPVVRGLNEEGRAEYRSAIVVGPRSPIRKIEDLRGKRFAFGDFRSTQGHLIPRIVLAEHGISLKDLGYYEFTGSHLNCANAVAGGSFDAGGIQDILGRELEAAGLIRIIHTSRYYPSSGIAANRDVPPEIRKSVEKALLDFQPMGRDAAGLYHWEKTEMSNGFKKAEEGDYVVLLQWAKKFGILGLDGKPDGK